MMKLSPHKQQTDMLTVPEGNTLVFLRKPSPQAMPVVKQVTFTAR